MANIPLVMVVNQTAKLHAQNLNPALFPVAGRPVTWVSSAPAVATVDANGRVTAISQGTTTVTATSGALTAAVDVAVGVRTPTSLSVSISRVQDPLPGT